MLMLFGDICWDKKTGEMQCIHDGIAANSPGERISRADMCP